MDLLSYRSQAVLFQPTETFLLLTSLITEERQERFLLINLSYFNLRRQGQECRTRNVEYRMTKRRILTRLRKIYDSVLTPEPRAREIRVHCEVRHVILRHLHRSSELCPWPEQVMKAPVAKCCWEIDRLGVGY